MLELALLVFAIPRRQGPRCLDRQTTFMAPSTVLTPSAATARRIPIRAVIINRLPRLRSLSVVAALATVATLYRRSYCANRISTSAKESLLLCRKTDVENGMLCWKQHANAARSFRFWAPARLL
jgi:hypothetical protein